MKTLLVAEYREGKLRAEYTQLIAFARELQAEAAMFLVGNSTDLPKFDGTLYLAEAAKHGEYSPAVHKQLLLDVIARESGKTIPQVALNWLLQRPTVSSVIIGARNAEQHRQNLWAVGWNLTPEQVSQLDEASAVTAPYPHFPYRRQEGFARINPPMAG